MPDRLARSVAERPSDPASDLRMVIDNLPAMVAYWDRDGINRLGNRAYVEWFGTEPEAMWGMHISELLGDAVYALNRSHIDGALAGEPQHFTRELIDAAGRRRTTQADYLPDMAGGEVQGFLALITDISDRIETERELERRADVFRALARDTPNGFVFLFDRDLRYTLADGSALGTFGHRSAELEGRTIFESLAPRLAAELEPRYRAALAGEATTWEQRHGRLTFTLTAGPVRDRQGEIFAGVVSGTDVSALRHSEAMNQALGDIATAVARHAAPAAIFAQVAESVRDLFAVDTALIARFEAPSAAVVLAAAPRLPAHVPSTLTFAPGDEGHSALAAVQRTARSSLVSFEGTERTLPAQLRAAGLVAAGGAPIRVRDRLWGALVIGCAEPGVLDQATLDQLTAFAELVELAVGNAEAWNALARDARTDALTGLANHRTFQERLREEVSHAGRHGGPLSLVLFDIDHFKVVNDTYGHQAGDLVLAAIAARLSPLHRGRELLARTGGEEFALILPGSDGVAAHAAADRLRTAVADAPLDAEIGTITISAGICELAQAGDAARLFDLADQALYAAKHLGRNRACRHDG
jgi:diguanylate cyclase (GGDEF)-like protein/PAS domain S-box-containing protein